MAVLFRVLPFFLCWGIIDQEPENPAKARVIIIRQKWYRAQKCPAVPKAGHYDDGVGGDTIMRRQLNPKF